MKQKSKEKPVKMGARFLCGVAAMTFTVASAFTVVNAQENPLWMRHSAISPDGSTIAFTYKGDIFIFYKIFLIYLKDHILFIFEYILNTNIIFIFKILII